MGTGDVGDISMKYRHLLVPFFLSSFTALYSSDPLTVSEGVFYALTSSEGKSILRRRSLRECALFKHLSGAVPLMGYGQMLEQVRLRFETDVMQEMHTAVNLLNSIAGRVQFKHALKKSIVIALLNRQCTIARQDGGTLLCLTSIDPMIQPYLRPQSTIVLSLIKVNHAKTGITQAVLYCHFVPLVPKHGCAAALYPLKNASGGVAVVPERCCHKHFTGNDAFDFSAGFAKHVTDGKHLARLHDLGVTEQNVGSVVGQSRQALRNNQQLAFHGVYANQKEVKYDDSTLLPVFRSYDAEGNPKGRPCAFWALEREDRQLRTVLDCGMVEGNAPTACCSCTCARLHCLLNNDYEDFVEQYPPYQNDSPLSAPDNLTVSPVPFGDQEEQDRACLVWIYDNCAFDESIADHSRVLLNTLASDINQIRSCRKMVDKNVLAALMSDPAIARMVFGTDDEDEEALL